MNLTFEEYGNRKNNTITIIHGLFGSAKNWHSIAKQLSKNYYVICINCRNHDKSFHTQSMTYPEMATDTFSLLNTLKIETTTLIGHSMGGKIAMVMALMQPKKITKQIIVDIAPKQYPDHYSKIIEALKKINLNNHKTRLDVSNTLKTSIPNQSLRQFLIKNISNTQPLTWQINLSAISDNYNQIMSWPSSLNNQIDIPTLIIKGKQSNYVSNTDNYLLKNYFNQFKIIELNTSHWVHAENPVEFIKAVNLFLNYQ